MKFLKRLDSAKNKHLVLVRSGNESIHREYFYNDPDRNWDTFVIVYEDLHPVDMENADYVANGGLSKNADVSSLIESGFFTDMGYEYIMTMDDDVLPVDSRQLSALFNIGREHKLSIFQPALTMDSKSSWNIVFNCPSFFLRYTNFVEVMCPVFSIDALLHLREDFKNSISGFGIDIVYYEALGCQKNSIAVIDTVMVQHTRASDTVGGKYYKHLRSHGVDIQEEFRFFMNKYSLKEKYFINFGGISLQQPVRV